ncbi:MAG TPA: Dam family site-specific DNA-(adenine-N6)-methyltransferase, partial [Vicinamibacterales bacterium]|nr:Dam family site-specific DNA-(adenine-N6)-methyltransferase [Vicinamibacterales bacterium]
APHIGRRLVEPFCGGLSVTLGLSPADALLNDANPHLVNFYRWLQRGLVMEIEMANDSRLYYRHRSRFNALIASGGVQSREAAELFYYLNRTGFNGLCRFNRRGLFNVPFGRYGRIAYCRDFTPYRETFERWRFSQDDIEALPIDDADFVYADPPYDVQFTQYATSGFGWHDQERTAIWLSKHRGPAVLVNQATPRIETLYRKLGFTIGYLNAPRRISCNGNRAPAREVIATRNL